jgi:hypothetical protein
LAIHGILFNEDSSERFLHDPPGTMQPERLDRIVDACANSQVTAMLLCCNADRTTYDTKAPGWSALCDGFDPAKDNSQPFFGDLPAENRVSVRMLAHNMRVMFDAGVCPMQRMIDRCRTRGISPWVSIRMNDAHDAPWPGSPLHSQFWKDHREYWRFPNQPEEELGSWSDRCLDYGAKPVRDRMMALVREACSRFDMDGVELDWNRFPLHFRVGEEAEGGRGLTAWIAEVRQVVREAEQKRKHPIWLAVRVPARPEVSIGTGLDVVTWAKRGLIDHLIVAPFFFTTDFDVPVDRWNELLNGTGVGVTVGLDGAPYRFYPAAPPLENTPEQIRGAAMGALARGSQGIYLFNYMNVGNSRPYLLKELGAVDTLASKDRSYLVTYTDIEIPNRPIAPALPKSLTPRKSATFPLYIGPKPSSDARAEITLTLKPEEPGRQCEAKVTLNGGSPVRTRGFEFPSNSFREGYNLIRIVNTGASTINVNGVELLLRFPKGGG